MHVPCLKSIPVAHFGVKAFCCLEIVVVSCWLCRLPVRLAVGLSQSFLVAFMALLGLLSLTGLVKKLLGRVVLPP